MVDIPPREDQRDARATFRTLRHGNTPPMVLQDLTRNRQSKARTADLCAEEWVDRTLTLFWGHALPIVIKT